MKYLPSLIRLADKTSYLPSNSAIRSTACYIYIPLIVLHKKRLHYAVMRWIARQAVAHGPKSTTTMSMYNSLVYINCQMGLFAIQEVRIGPQSNVDTFNGGSIPSTDGALNTNCLQTGNQVGNTVCLKLVQTSFHTIDLKVIPLIQCTLLCKH